jgi:hypothetical protein
VRFNPHDEHEWYAIAASFDGLTDKGWLIYLELIEFLRCRR